MLRETEFLPKTRFLLRDFLTWGKEFSVIIAADKVDNHQFIIEAKMARHNNDSIHIGTDRQLFVDDFWIAEAKMSRSVCMSRCVGRL